MNPLLRNRLLTAIALSSLVCSHAVPSPLTAPPIFARTSPASNAIEDVVRCRYGDRDRGNYRAISSTVQAIPPGNTAPGNVVMTQSPKSKTTSPPQTLFLEDSVGEDAQISHPHPHPYPTPPIDDRYGTSANSERYIGEPVAAIQRVADTPVSTFAIDVDSAAYSNMRRFLRAGNLPPADAVRSEEFINYFRYDYPRATKRIAPFSVTTHVTLTPWNPDTRLLRIGLRGYDSTAHTRPAANLVFLIDVSGSMSSPDKLGLVKQSLIMLANNLTKRDSVAIVVYAGASGLVLAPTHDHASVKAAIDCLESGGSTAGESGLKLAYQTARANFTKGGINRILLATDGDFNVGIADRKELEALITKQREDGITLTTLGFGIGNYNDALMEKLANVGNGTYAYIDSRREARKVLDEQLSATLLTIAKDVKVQVEFNPAVVKEYRLIGYENRALAEEDFTNDAVDAGDMGAGHQVTALYEIAVVGTGGWLGARRYAANQRGDDKAKAAHLDKKSGTERPGTERPGTERPGTERPGTGESGTGRELGFVKLRYKLPREKQSRLIAHAVSARLLDSARAPQGDVAFVAAVAAFGQKLRGDKLLSRYSYPQIIALAGEQENEYRREFITLVHRADTLHRDSLQSER